MENRNQENHLKAVVIQIQSAIGGSIQGGSGRAVQGLWLDPWKEINPPTGDELHDGDLNSSFSLSPLMGLPRPVKGITQLNPGDQAWLRLAALSNASCEALQFWITHLPQEVCIARVPFQVAQVFHSTHEHPWAGETTYEKLVAASYRNVEPADRWMVCFETPTTFHGVSGHFPFPVPDSLAKSWLARWKQHSPIPIPEDLPSRVRESVQVSSYELKTVPVRYGKRLTVGFVGDIFLRAGKLNPQERAAFDALSAYSFYAGTGQYTHQGMGLTRAAWG